MLQPMLAGQPNNRSTLHCYLVLLPLHFHPHRPPPTAAAIQPHPLFDPTSSSPSAPSLLPSPAPLSPHQAMDPPAAGSSSVASRFVSEASLEEAKATRAQQWKEAYERLGQEAPPPEEDTQPYDGRSLWEKLQENKVSSLRLSFVQQCSNRVGTRGERNLFARPLRRTRG